MIEEIIENFKFILGRKNLDKLSIEEWFNIFSKELSGKFVTTQYKINPQFVYRARINYDWKKKVPIDFFQNTNELWAPPPKCVNRKGRCNTKNQSILYLSSERFTTILETEPEKGQEITIIEYSVKRDFGLVGAIGVKILSQNREDLNRLFVNHFKGHSEISEFLDIVLTQFFICKNNPKLKLDIYNLTNAITQIFLYDTPNIKNNDMRPLLKSIGLLYPSVKSNLQILNFAFEPELVKDYLKCERVFKYKIIDKKGNTFYKLLLTDICNSISFEEEIKWVHNFSKKFDIITNQKL